MEIQLEVRPYYRGKFDRESLLNAVKASLVSCYSQPVIVGLLVSGNREIQQMNRDYRGMDKPTDVLSFNQNYTDPETGLEYIGDIILAVPYAGIQAKRDGHSLDEELQLLAIHGVLHLAGFDHDTTAREKVMWQEQSRLLASTGNPLAQKFMTGIDG